MTSHNPIPIRNKPFDIPAAWTTQEITGKADFTIELGSEHIEAFDKALEGIKSRELTDIDRKDFLLPSITEDLDKWRQQIEHGCGMLILKGFPIDRYSEQEIERLWFGLGMHFGRAVSQSVLGDLVGHVVNVAGPDSRQRAYRNNRELHFHTDRCDTVGMFSLQRAWKGGVSSFCSALSVHNEIMATRPELLEPLWRGFHLHKFGEQLPGESPYSPLRIPVFSERDGVTSVIYLRGYVDMAASEFDLPVSDLEWEALDTFEEICNQPKFSLDFSLEPGEAMLFNNNAILHKRAGFEDHEDPKLKRHLMRLWLMDWTDRPVAETVVMHKGPGGIPLQEGRIPFYAGRQ